MVEDNFLEGYYRKFVGRFNRYSGIRIPDWFTIEEFDKLRNKTQDDRVLWHLEKFGKITNLIGFEVYRICHIPRKICNLRERFKFEKNGYEIINRTKEGVNSWGKKCTYDEYVLIKNEDKGIA